MGYIVHAMLMGKGGCAGSSAQVGCSQCSHEHQNTEAFRAAAAAAAATARAARAAGAVEEKHAPARRACQECTLGGAGIAAAA